MRMRIKEEWTRATERKVVDRYVVVRVGRPGSSVANLLEFNDTGIFLWRALKGKEFAVSDVAALLAAEFGLAETEAVRDAEAWVGQLRDCDLTDE